MTEILRAVHAALAFESPPDDRLAMRLGYVRSQLVTGILQAHLEHEPYLPIDTVNATTLSALHGVAAGLHDEEALALLDERLDGP